MGRLTTHVLDTANGRHGRVLKVEFFRLNKMVLNYLRYSMGA